MPAIQLIVGLGNPGAEYQLTRHNAGFWFVDELARQGGQAFRLETRFHSDVARCRLEGREYRLQKPLTYMNRSGQAVRALMQFFRIPVDEILVVHDELDLPAGTVRLKTGGGHGGHNGLRDLVNHLGSKAFHRLRVGIDHPGDKRQVVDYVLKQPGKEDRRLIEAAMDSALEVMPLVIAGHLDKAMHQLHSQNK